MHAQTDFRRPGICRRSSDIQEEEAARPAGDGLSGGGDPGVQRINFAHAASVVYRMDTADIGHDDQFQTWELYAAWKVRSSVQQ